MYQCLWVHFVSFIQHSNWTYLQNKFCTFFLTFKPLVSGGHSSFAFYFSIFFMFMEFYLLVKTPPGTFSAFFFSKLKKWNKLIVLRIYKPKNNKNWSFNLFKSWFGDFFHFITSWLRYKNLGGCTLRLTTTELRLRSWWVWV